MPGVSIDRLYVPFSMTLWHAEPLLLPPLGFDAHIKRGGGGWLLDRFMGTQLPVMRIPSRDHKLLQPEPLIRTFLKRCRFRSHLICWVERAYKEAVYARVQFRGRSNIDHIGRLPVPRQASCTFGHPLYLNTNFQSSITKCFLF